MKISLPSDRPPRILVTRTDRIGDLVLSTPVFSEIRKAFPKAWIACITFLENRQIVEGNPHLSEVILYDKKGSEKKWWGNISFAQKLKKKKFDVVIHLHGTNRMHWITWFAGIPVRIGWDRRLKWALTNSHPYLKKEGKKHEALYNFDLLEDLGIKCPEKLEMHFPAWERDKRSLEELIEQRQIPRDKPWVVINPSASDPSKIWPPQNFGELVDALSKKYDVAVVAIGARKDHHYVEDVRHTSKVKIYDLSGAMNLGMLGICLRRSALLISNDSGPVHIAQAVGTPVISIFVRTDPGLNPTRWQPLYDNAKTLAREGLEVSEVLQAASSFLPADTGQAVPAGGNS